MKPEIEALFCAYLRVAGNDKPTAAILTLADVLAPGSGTEMALVDERRFLTVEETGKRLNLASRLVYQKCLVGELRPVKVGRTIYIPAAEIERYEAGR